MKKYTVSAETLNQRLKTLQRGAQEVMQQTPYPSAEVDGTTSPPITLGGSCTACGAVSTGAFCSSCGAAIKSRLTDTPQNLPRWELRISSGPDAGASLTLHARDDLGRAPDNELVLKDQRTSRHHAHIEFKDGAFFLSDLKSSNGTTLNGARVTKELQLHPGDVIHLGDTDALVVSLERLPDQEPPPGLTPTLSLPSPISRWELVLHPGTPTEARVPLHEEDTHIGRAPDNEIDVPDDAYMSRHHVVIHHHQAGYLIEDLGSRMGTLLNQERLQEPTPLHPGDKLIVGRTAFEVRVAGERCKSCGEENEPGARFCAFCGADSQKTAL